LIPVGQIAKASSSKATRTRRFTVFDPEFVMFAADVLDESVPGTDHFCAAELFETAHRSEPEL
jgi:hypothetical protein